MHVECNTRGVRNQTLDDEEEHQPQLMRIADIGSPYAVKVLMDDGRVLAEIIEQMGEISMQGTLSDSRQDQGVPIDKTLRVTEAATVSVKTDGPMTHLEPLSDVGAQDIEELNLDIGEAKSDNTVMKCWQGITGMIAEMHTNDFIGNERKKYHGLLIYNKRDFDTNVEEKPLLSWVVMTTQQTVSGGEYTVQIDYEDNLLVTKVDHTLGSEMIDVVG